MSATLFQREQIDPWYAIEFATNPVFIDDHFDRLEFLNSVQEQDMGTIGDEYPDFVRFVREKKQEDDDIDRALCSVPYNLAAAIRANARAAGDTFLLLRLDRLGVAVDA